jgi:5-methyltetrahydropteroyltriglutamate--homocysteine methyltransferase
MGQLLPEDMADAQHRVMQAAVVAQETAGIDIITGGETHRRTHNRHSPPNAMLNYFWQKIPAIQYDPNVTHPAAICRGQITDSVDLGLVDEFKEVSAYARRPVKITMTGPHFLL